MNNGGDEVMAQAGPPEPLDWKFSQAFGERAAGEEVQEGILLILSASVIYLFNLKFDNN